MTMKMETIGVELEGGRWTEVKVPLDGSDREGYCCRFGAATVQQLITAGSAGKYYNQNIRSRPDGSRGAFDCRDHPMPNYP
jgi:hypothetical protein